MKKTLFYLFLIFVQVNSYSQNTTSRLRILSGGSMYFNFNSLQKYENGLTYSNWTRAEVYFIDTTNLGVQTLLEWRLDVKAMTPLINGDAGYSLPLNTIEIESNGLNATYNGPFAISDADDVHLVEDGLQTAPGYTIVNITYHCGKSLTVGNNLLGSDPDYYFVDLLFTLQPE